MAPTDLGIGSKGRLAHLSFVADVGEEKDIVLRVTTGRIDGHVLDAASGAPIEGAAIEVQLESPATGNSGSARLGAKSDAAGAFTIDPAVAGGVRLHVDAPHYSHFDSDPLVIAAGAAPTPVDVRLKRGVAVSGVVKLPHGLDMEDVSYLELTGAGLPTAKDGIDEESGEFEIDGVIPGDYSARVVMDSEEPLEPLPLTVPQGGRTDVVLEPVLGPPVPMGHIGGKVEVPGGAPRLVTAFVLHRLDATQDDRRVRVRPGTFEFRENYVPAGKYRLTLQPHADAFAPLEFDVPAEESEELVLKFALAASAPHDK